ncbi:hypothetical protein AAVH_06492 [Aphelenchoides avenae]|nr:hypothetical protein AAVH_06492 [Aphelenchus avenae]
MLPSTVLVNILVYLKRRDLDVFELVDRAFGAVIETHENHLPRRSLSLTFFNERGVSLDSFKDTMKYVSVVKMPQYLPHSVHFFRAALTSPLMPRESSTCFPSSHRTFYRCVLHAKGALERLLGTHAPAAGVKHLFIEDIDVEYSDAFCSTFIAALEQQFIHATTPASFTVELGCSVERQPGPAVETRPFENPVTNEQLEVVVNTPNAFKRKVTIRRKPAA